ncbi:MAG: glycosyltransferase [Bacteroidota bacterium]
MKKYRIFVFANLKPSQIEYKIIPLSESFLVEHVYVLRKKPLNLSNPKITCLYLPWILRQRPLYWFFTAIFGMFKIKKFKTNLILSYNIFPHGFNAYVASKILKQPTIFSDICEDTKNYYQKKIPYLLINKIFKNATVICTPGSNTANFWDQNGYLKTSLLHSSINIEKFKPDFNKTKKYDYIFIGTFDNNKRPDVIINIFSKIKNEFNDVKLCIIGFGELEKSIVQQISNLHLENEIDLIKTNNVLELLQSSKALVMASKSEGIPCAMMEAMACELIVIIPPVGDITDVVKHATNGYLHNNTEEDILKWMIESYKNYDDLEFMRKNARETIINHHSFESATKKWDELLNRI